MKERFFGKIYEAIEECEKIKPLLIEAEAYQRTETGYLIPYSYWTDRKGWLYIKWSTDDDPGIKPVWRYSYDAEGKLRAEKIPVNMSGIEKLRGNDPDAPAVLITGDTHGSFDRIIHFCRKYHTSRKDIMIILGDAGINYAGDPKDDALKYKLSKLDITLFCIRGNHEMRPETTGKYAEKEWHGGQVYIEEKYPDLIFAKDGEIYDIGGYKTIVIGGAYSVDKFYRLERGHKWFSDEQPSEYEKQFVVSQLEKRDWQIDVVLSHTVPYKYRPIDLFLRELNQSTVDDSTERWLGEIEDRLTYKKWYAGHFHCDRTVDRLNILYGKVDVFMKDVDLDFKMR